MATKPPPETSPDRATLLALTCITATLVELLAASGRLRFADFDTLLRSRAEQLRPDQPLAATIADALRDSIARNLEEGMKRSTPRGSA